MRKFIILAVVLAVLIAGCASQEGAVKIIKLNKTNISQNTSIPSSNATQPSQNLSNASANATSNITSNLTSNLTNATSNQTANVSATSANIRNLTIDFINLDGNSILIRTPNRKNAIIDGGANSDGLRLVKYVMGKGIMKFDYVFASNAELDNAGGLPSIIFNFNDSQAYYSGISYGTNYLSYRNYQTYSTAYSHPPIAIENDRSFEIDNGVELQAFLPYEDNQSNGMPRDDTMVFRLDYKDASFLFLGDCTDSPCFDKIKGKGISADVLKVNGVVSEQVIGAVSPKIIVYDTITNQTIKPEGVKVYSKEDGTVMIMSDGEKYFISIIGKE